MGTSPGCAGNVRRFHYFPLFPSAAIRSSAVSDARPFSMQTERLGLSHFIDNVNA